MKKATAEEVCSILFDNLMAYFAVPMRIICDQDPAFMFSICQWFFKAYGIQLVTVSATNYKFLQVEHEIKSLSNILMSCTEVFQGIRFFFIIVKYRNYHRCSRDQYRLMLHLMFHLLERSVKLCKVVR